MKLTLYFKGGKCSFDNLIHLPNNRLFMDTTMDVMIRIDFNDMEAQVVTTDVDVTYKCIKIEME